MHFTKCFGLFCILNRINECKFRRMTDGRGLLENRLKLFGLETMFMSCFLLNKTIVNFVGLTVKA